MDYEVICSRAQTCKDKKCTHNHLHEFRDDEDGDCCTESICDKTKRRVVCGKQVELIYATIVKEFKYKEMNLNKMVCPGKGKHRRCGSPSCGIHVNTPHDLNDKCSNICEIALNDGLPGIKCYEFFTEVYNEIIKEFKYGLQAKGNR